MLDRDEKTIRKHINNIFKDREVEKENNTQKMRVVGVGYPNFLGVSNLGGNLGDNKEK